jgi:lipopolysaccharide biosynthesis glycosyltransferase
MIRLFIGYDKVESIAYHTMVQSIINTTSVPVSITPVKMSMLPEYTRSRDPKQSNEFSFTRFLVPYLCDYEGWAIFMDCDMFIRTDLKELWKLRDPTKSVQVVKHDYTPKTQTKFLGAIQHPYPRKNWSSVMLFNCEKCRTLTPGYVNTAAPADLHRMKWAEEIGELPVEWNHLVGEYDKNPNASNVHWTIGGPYFNENVEFSEEWFKCRDDVLNCAQLERPKGKVVSIAANTGAYTS